MKRKGSLNNLNESTKKQKLNIKNEEEKNNPQPLFLNLFDYHTIQQIFIQLVTEHLTSKEQNENHENNQKKDLPKYEKTEDKYNSNSEGSSSIAEEEEENSSSSEDLQKQDKNPEEVILEKYKKKFENYSSFSSTCKQFNLISKNTSFKFNIFEKEGIIQNIKYPIYLKLNYIKQYIIKKQKKSQNSTLKIQTKEEFLNKILFWGTEYGFFDIIKPLVLNGANINYKNEKFGLINCLSESCSNGFLKTTKKLIKNGANINFLDDYENNLLHLACENDNLNLIKYLIEEKGLNINSQNEDFETPLFTACFYGNLKIAKYLISLNIDTNQKNSIKETILFSACHSKNLKLIKYLLDLNLDINHLSSFEKTCVQMSCENQDLEIVKLLISKGADLSIKYEGKKKNIDTESRKKYL